jgi:hypothetical protein
MQAVWRHGMETLWARPNRLIYRPAVLPEKKHILKRIYSNDTLPAALPRVFSSPVASSFATRPSVRIPTQDEVLYTLVVIHGARQRRASRAMWPIGCVIMTPLNRKMP